MQLGVTWETSSACVYFVPGKNNFFLLVRSRRKKGYDSKSHSFFLGAADVLDDLFVAQVKNDKGG